MKPSDNEIEMLAAGFAIQHKNGLIRFAHALLEKYASARAIAFDAGVAEEAQPVAYLTLDEEGSPNMLFFDVVEARGYCAPGEDPEPLFRHAAPQASADAGITASEDVRDAALDEAIQAISRITTSYATFTSGNPQYRPESRPASAAIAEAIDTLLALKTQSDKDGGQWEPQTPEQIAAAMRNMARSQGFYWPDPASAEGIRSPSNACMHRNECRAMLDRQQRAEQKGDQ